MSTTMAILTTTMQPTIIGCVRDFVNIMPNKVAKSELGFCKYTSLIFNKK